MFILHYIEYILKYFLFSTISIYKVSLLIKINEALLISRIRFWLFLDSPSSFLILIDLLLLFIDTISAYMMNLNFSNRTYYF